MTNMTCVVTAPEVVKQS